MMAALMIDLWANLKVEMKVDLMAALKVEII
jgi:hypothetical protein